MEFTLDNENVQIILKEEDLNSTNNNNFQNNNNFNNQINFEILLKLQDFYLINNIKILGNLEDFQIDKIKFQNVNTNQWEAVNFFNPDNHKEIKILETDSLSIFSVGLTQFIKIELHINCHNEINFTNNDNPNDNINTYNDGNRTLGIPEYKNNGIITTEEINQNFQTHNYSSNAIIGNNETENNYRKKNIFNLNLNMQKVNSLYGNINRHNENKNSSDDINNNINNLNIHKNFHSQINTQNYIQILKNSMKKIIVFSQYIYSIPNSTFLLTLLNIKNFFLNSLNEDKINSNYENYLSSLFLTAASMIQARLFIQAWELFNKFQIETINNINFENFNFFKTILGVKLEEINLDNLTPLLLTKLEIIKAICMFEHGHTLSFLESLKNCINIYFHNDYSCIKLNHSWTKNNEIGSDKFYIQNFIFRYGKDLSTILIILIEDVSEIISYSSLKVIEFILDYNASTIFDKFGKIIKILVNRQNFNNKNYNVHKDEIIIENKLNCQKLFEEKNIYFPNNLFVMFKENNNCKKLNKNEQNINDNKNSINNPNNISPILLKQLNYTLDTLINNLEFVPTLELQKIAEKTNLFLLQILINSENENSILTMNIIKLLRKLYDSLNTNLMSLFKCKNKNNFINNFISNIFNLLTISITPDFIQTFRDFFQNNQNFTNNSTNKSILKYSQQNLKQNSNFSNLSEILIDNSEIGNLLNFILDKISEDCLLFNDREDYIQLFNFLIKSLDCIKFQLKNNMRMTLFTNPSNSIYNEEEFLILYTFILLNFCNIFFFNKIEIKSEVNKIFNKKFHLEIIKILNQFLQILIEIEEVCLSSKKSLILFVIIIDIFEKIKKSYSNIFRINFSKIFYKQFENISQFMIVNGIFNENIFYLLKTVNLIEMENIDPKFMKILQNIFIIILNNFCNFYSEEMFDLFSLMLNKLKNNLNTEIVDKIVIAIIHKFNYKGQSFKICCDSFFNVILLNSNKIHNINIDRDNCNDENDYFIMFKENLHLSLNKINLLFKNDNCNDLEILKNKESYLELLEKLELYKKYLEYLKNDNNLNLLFINNNINSDYCEENNQMDKIILKISNLLFNNEEIINSLISTAKLNDDTITIRINEVLCESFDLVDYILKYITNINNQNGECINNLISNNNLLLTLKENTIHIDNTFLSEFLSIFSDQISFTQEYFQILNRTIKNPITLSEVFKTMSKINLSNNNISESLNNFNKNTIKDSITLSQSESPIKFLIKQESEYNQNLYKLNFYQSLIQSINFTFIQEINLKTTITELMNFIETTIIKINNITEEEFLKNYYNFLIPLINFFLDSSDDFQKIFGIEIILKFFNIKFEDEKGYKIEADILEKNYFPIFIWEKILKLINHFNYRISLFAVYVIQILGPKEEIENLILQENENENNNICKENIFIEIVENNSNKFFMNENKILHLHLFIRDKIIFDYKVKNTLEKNNELENKENLNYNFNPLLSNENEFINNKIDEVNDYIDFIQIPNLDNLEEELDEKLKSSEEINSDIFNNNYNENNENNYNEQDSNVKSDNMSLEDLGVFEVEHEIFENFDEENIPVIKNNYRRKKGSAEKLKTNQNTRNLLMSNHLTNIENEVRNNLIENDTNYYNNKNDYNNINNLNNKNDKKLEIETQSKNYNSCIKIENKNNNKYDNYDIDEEEDLLPDLQIKKSNYKLFNIFRKYKTSKWIKTCYTSIKTN